MKARELQIGDWVIHDYYKTPIQIKAIPNAEQIYHPIPLTPEILEKNGFNEIGEGFELPSKYLAKSRFFIFNNKKALCIMAGGDWVSLHYVHQLQQILRLCGLDELATNFKI